MVDRKLQISRLRCAFFMLIIYPIFHLIIVAEQYVGLDLSENNLMIGLYSLVLIYSVRIILKGPVYKKSLFALFVIYFAILILYLFSHESVKPEYVSTYNKIMYFYFLPVCVFVISEIDNWEELLTNKNYVFVSDLIIIVSLISKLFLNDNTDYMAFAYDILPFACIVLLYAIRFKKMKQWVISIAALFELGVYGARGALLAFIICGVLIYLIDLYYSESLQVFATRLILAILLVVALVAGVAIALPKLVNSDFVTNSYVLKRISLGMIGESNARTTIMTACIDAIKGMGLYVNGLYYDRVILPNGLYSHNFVLESLLSLGWIFGLLFLGWIIISQIRAFFYQTQTGKIVFVFFFAALFTRYFLSGSIFGEGKFILFMAVIMSLNKNKVNLESKRLTGG